MLLAVAPQSSSTVSHSILLQSTVLYCTTQHLISPSTGVDQDLSLLRRPPKAMIDVDSRTDAAVDASALPVTAGAAFRLSALKSGSGLELFLWATWFLGNYCMTRRAHYRRTACVEGRSSSPSREVAQHLLGTSLSWIFPGGFHGNSLHQELRSQIMVPVTLATAL